MTPEQMTARQREQQAEHREWKRQEKFRRNREAAKAAKDQVISVIKSNNELLREVLGNAMDVLGSNNETVRDGLGMIE